MSETKKALDAHFADVEQKAKDYQSLQEKKYKLDDYRVSLQLREIEQAKEDLKKQQESNFDLPGDEYANKIIKQNTEYFHAARNPLLFINSAFHDQVPFFSKNVILIGAKTGMGKSTALANIAYSMCTQKRPDGTPRRILVLTNEESVNDVYNRITCLARGWHYVKHNRFTDEQIDIMNKNISVFLKDGRITVIDDNYNGVSGSTSTIEGIRNIFNNLMTNKIQYDAIVIDYYQNVSLSKDNTALGPYECQDRFNKMLDHFKNDYPAPVVLLAQLTGEDEEEKPFKYRIEGRKSISNTCTFSMELINDRERSMSRWVIHKSRYAGSVGTEIETGFDKGLFVVADPSWKANKLAEKEKEMHNDLVGKHMKGRPNGSDSK